MNKNSLSKRPNVQFWANRVFQNMEYRDNGLPHNTNTEHFQAVMTHVHNINNATLSADRDISLLVILKLSKLK